MDITQFLYEARKRKIIDIEKILIRNNTGTSVLIKEIKPDKVNMHKLKVLLALNQINFIMNHPATYTNPETQETQQMESIVCSMNRNDIACYDALRVSELHYNRTITDKPEYRLFTPWGIESDYLKKKIKKTEDICGAFFKEFKVGKTDIEGKETELTVFALR